MQANVYGDTKMQGGSAIGANGRSPDVIMHGGSP